jgi:hypothetical protein
MELDHTSSILNENLIMFIDYKKPTGELVADLINRDNPDLPFPIKANECFFGTPVAWSAAGNFRNTEMTITPRSNSPYIGGFKVRYRRLALQSLLPDNAMVWFDEWYATAVVLLSDVLAALNKRTGLSLVEADTTSFASFQVYGNTTSRSYLTMNAKNPAFTGQITCGFLARYPTDLHVPAAPPMLVHWDGVPRNEADPLRRYATYGHDFSAFSDYLETWSTSTAKALNPTDLDLLNLVEYIATITGQPFDLGADTTPGGLLSAYGLRYILPNASGYFNSDDYNRCVILYRSSKLTNMPDILYLHYKV